MTILDKLANYVRFYTGDYDADYDLQFMDFLNCYALVVNIPNSDSYVFIGYIKDVEIFHAEDEQFHRIQNMFFIDDFDRIYFYPTEEDMGNGLNILFKKIALRWKIANNCY